MDFKNDENIDYEQMRVDLSNSLFSSACDFNKVSGKLLKSADRLKFSKDNIDKIRALSKRIHKCLDVSALKIDFAEKLSTFPSDELKEMMREGMAKGREDNKNHLSFLEKYTNQGWFVPIKHFPVGLLTKLTDISIINEKDISGYIEYCVQMEKDISNFNRSNLIENAIKLHYNENYSASIPLFFLSIEGELRDIWKKRYGSKLIKKEDLTMHIIEVIEEENFNFQKSPSKRQEFIDNICNRYNYFGVKIKEMLKTTFKDSRDNSVGSCKKECEICDRKDKFNRDIVLHGSCPLYGTRVNSCKAMSRLFLVKEMISFRDYIKKEAHQFEAVCENDLKGLLSILGIDS